ncbi:MAG: YicC family protein [Bacteroidetes bacterium]|nr:YicC family protein [Bacteroidota bacterium]
MENTAIQSMTGFGRSESTDAGIKVVCEIKALNGRYLDLDIRLPRFLYELDAALRKLLQEKLERGSVTMMFNIEFTGDENAPDISINHPMAKTYLDKLSHLSQSLNLDFRDPFNQIIRMPEVVGSAEKTLSAQAKNCILQTAAQALKKLIEFRKQEGKSILKKLTDASAEIRKQLTVVESEEEPRRQNLRNKINNSVVEHVRDNIVDPNRLEQEILLYVEKWDIAEEKQRLRQHLDYFDECLKKEPLGRKLNFISQEMGREMNTMGVKSNHFPMQQAVVLMKEKLEQIKEQVLNIV